MVTLLSTNCHVNNTLGDYYIGISEKFTSLEKQ
jgi:hypothetical protein